MNRFRDYVSPVAVNPATGFSSPAQLADNRPKRFFYVRRMASSFGRPCGEPSGSPVPTAGLLTRTVALPFSSGRAVFESLSWSIAMSRKKPTPVEDAPLIVIDDALETVSTALYYLQHQLQLVADLAAAAKPGTQCTGLLAESVSVALGSYAETAGGLSTQLDHLAIYCRRREELRI